jgi:N-carbamoylputrescine amidase
LGRVVAIVAAVILLELHVAAGNAEQPQANHLRIALVQPVPKNDPLANHSRAVQFCREAAAKQADIVLFPEMFSVGYQTTIDFDNRDDVARWTAKARQRDGEYISHFQDLAKELEIAIAITYLERYGDELRNATSLIDRHGRMQITYAKVHTCTFFPMEANLRPGDAFYVEELDTRLGAVKVGVMTCYDREFPESARTLMLKGAELILTPNACGLDKLRINQFQIRAWENAVAVAMANYAEGQGNGKSCAFTADGSEIVIGDDQPGIVFADIDMKHLREVRGRTFWGNAWRRTGAYEGLLSPTVKAPFHRIDALGRRNSTSVESK